MLRDRFIPWQGQQRSWKGLALQFEGQRPNPISVDVREANTISELNLDLISDSFLLIRKFLQDWKHMGDIFHLVLLMGVISSP